MINFLNPGVIPLEAFTTFGMSAKPNSTNPIGKFGTGLKISIAVILRLGGTIKLWRGLEEYVFYTKPEDFRGKEFQMVRMKKRKGVMGSWAYTKLPFTTELGKHWEPWMALRELEANVRDEDGYSAVDGTGETREWMPTKDKTLIVVDCAELEEAYANVESLFLPKQEPVYENHFVEVLPGASNHIYYRGMRVTDLDKPSKFTYNLKECTLTEDRTSKEHWWDKIKIRDSLAGCGNKDVVADLIKMKEDDWESSLDWDDIKRPGQVSMTFASALAYTPGLYGRLGELQKGLSAGIPDTQRVSINLPAGQWQNLVDAIEGLDMPEEFEIAKQLEKQGWKGAKK